MNKKPPLTVEEMHKLRHEMMVESGKFFTDIPLQATLESGERVEAWPIYQKLNFGKLD